MPQQPEITASEVITYVPEDDPRFANKVTEGIVRAGMAIGQTCAYLLVAGGVIITAALSLPVAVMFAITLGLYRLFGFNKMPTYEELEPIFG